MSLNGYSRRSTYQRDTKMKPKEFYKLEMGSMIDEEYTSRFLELLRYVPYLKEEMANIHRFISGLSYHSRKGLSLMNLYQWRRPLKI